VAIDRHPRTPELLVIEVPANADRLAEVRTRLSRWLGTVGASGPIVNDIVLAVDEACTNCIEHAYADIDSGLIHIDAVSQDSEITVEVSDSGVWRTPTPARNRGRGLSIMRAVAAHVDLDESTSGTTVRMVFEVPGCKGPCQDGGKRTT
jgi:serine/threonine-protein kinase RsbW